MHESEKWKWSRSVMSDSATPWPAAYQAPPSMGFSRQEYWSGLPLPSLILNIVAKSLQLCPTLCDPIDSSPPGSPIPGVLQARIVEWAAISFSGYDLSSWLIWPIDPFERCLSKHFPGGQWLRFCLPMQGVRVQSLVRELRSYTPRSQKIKTWNRSNIATNSIKNFKMVQNKKRKKS